MFEELTAAGSLRHMKLAEVGFDGQAARAPITGGVLVHEATESASGLWLSHAPRIERFAKLILGQNLLFQAQLANGLTGRKGFLGKFCRHLVPDQRVQAGTHRKALLDRGLAGFGVWFHVIHTEFNECFGAAGEQMNRFQHRVSHDGHHDVKLKIATGRAAGRDAGVIAHHPRRQLHHRFAHDRIHLARHDAAAGLSTGQFDFVESTPRSNFPASGYCSRC